MGRYTYLQKDHHDWAGILTSLLLYRIWVLLLLSCFTKTPLRYLFSSYCGFSTHLGLLLGHRLVSDASLAYFLFSLALEPRKGKRWSTEKSLSLWAAVYAVATPGLFVRKTLQSKSGVLSVFVIGVG
jgi:hypothetical protein